MKNLFSIFWFSKLLDTSESYIHWVGLKKYFSKEFINYYQNGRLYLDEYEGQKELRKEWFNKTARKFIQYDIEKSHLDYQNGNYDKIIDDIVNNFCYFESDQIFYNKWLKRK